MKRRKLFATLFGFVGASFVLEQKPKLLGFNPPWTVLPYPEWEQYLIETSSFKNGYVRYRGTWKRLLKEIIHRNEPRQYT